MSLPSLYHVHMWSTRLMHRSLTRLTSPSTCHACLQRGLASANENRFQFSNGRLFKISSGKFAKMADGCAVVNSGDTNVMVTAVSAKTSRTSSGFMPLTVDYRQKAAAAGRIPTHHLRRELGATEKEILTSRIIDRSIRPLFPKGYNNETQLVCNVLSLDGQNDPDVLAINAASAALAVSDIPWSGPIGAVRVALDTNNNIITNPTRKESNEAKLNLVITTNDLGNVLMMEAFANVPVLEQELMKALAKAIRECKFVISSIKQLQNEIGKPKRAVEQVDTQKYIDAIKTVAYARLNDVLCNHSHDKQSRDQAISTIREDVMVLLKAEFTSPEDSSYLNEAFFQVLKTTYAELVINTGIRCDGRDLNQLRPISCEVDLFKPVHGSALFQRGQTQVMCTATLDSLDSTWRADAITALTQGIKEKNFMLHYEFPQFATNDIGKGPGFGRREIGHGALAERALRPVVPKDSLFTTRLLCEVLESNGSSSMASVCAGSLALMDAGVNIESPMAGVALGLIQHGDEYRVLTDIMGMEDYFGEMDFKIAGSRKAFTALQLDCKLTDGLPFKILYEAIQKSNTARVQIINIMGEVISIPRQKSKETMPITEQFEVPHNKRSKLLGVGWSNAKRLMSETGVNLTQDAEDVNMFNIFAPNQAAMDEAKEWINSVLSEPNMPEFEFGAIYQCKVVEVRENGVMVQLHPSINPTFLHLSQLDVRKVNHPSVLNIEEGSVISVKYFGRDPVSGQIRISRKVLQALESPMKNFITE